jgi:hypothetical protein
MGVIVVVVVAGTVPPPPGEVPMHVSLGLGKRVARLKTSNLCRAFMAKGGFSERKVSTQTYCGPKKPRLDSLAATRNRKTCMN